MDNNRNNLYTKEDLLNLGIYELRDLGRDVGVHSPTTLKKEELVNNILSIIYGETPKQVVGKGRGRPARKKEKPNKLFVELVENVEEPDLINIAYGNLEDEVYTIRDLINTKVASPLASYVNDGKQESNSYLKSGVLCEEDGKFFIRKLKFIKSDNDCELNKQIVKDYKLKENDRIEYLIDNENKDRFQLFKINGEYINNVNKNAKVDDSKLDVYVEDVKISVGKSNVIYASTLEERERFVDSVCDWFDNVGYNTVKVCYDRNLKLEDKISSVIKAELFASCVGDEYETMALTEMGIDKAVFFAMLNNKSVLVIDNLGWLMKVINTYPASIYGNFIQKMIKTCKNANVTLVCLSGYLKNDEVQELSTFVDNIEKLN